jgi:CPA2 family monovalent cation:H+ antiporter-2
VKVTPGAVDVRRMVEIARTHNEEEGGLLRRESLGEVFLGEHELARGMAAHILSRLEAPGARRGA